jgi:hypothetical protein
MATKAKASIVNGVTVTFFIVGVIVGVLVGKIA